MVEEAAGTKLLGGEQALCFNNTAVIMNANRFKKPKHIAKSLSISIHL